MKVRSAPKPCRSRQPDAPQPLFALSVFDPPWPTGESPSHRCSAPPPGLAVVDAPGLSRHPVVLTTWCGVGYDCRFWLCFTMASLPPRPDAPRPGSTLHTEDHHLRGDRFSHHCAALVGRAAHSLTAEDHPLHCWLSALFLFQTLHDARPMTRRSFRNAHSFCSM